MLILLTPFHTLHIFLAEFNRFPELSGTSGLFLGFPVLENAIVKFQDFPGFPGPVRTLYHAKRSADLYVLDTYFT